MKKTPFVKYAFWATLAFLVFICFLKRNNLMNLISASVQLHRQQNRIEWLEEDIDRLDGRIRELKEDKDSLETFARENFYFAEPGDDIYIISEE